MTMIPPDGDYGTADRDLLLESLERYRRGLADAPLLRKWSMARAPGGELTAVDHPVSPQGAEEAEETAILGGIEGTAAKEAESGFPMTFVISNEEVDRHGDVVLARGWRLQAYLSNPVFLWAHDYGRPAIGRSLAVWTERAQLMARMEFAPTAFAREVAALYRTGYQQAVSVGFRPLRYEERRDERTGAFLGIRFLEQELLEVSAVPVPANRHALRRGLEKGESPGPAPEVPLPLDPLREVLAALRSAAR